jgi:adenine phosphoribosyltransferase
LGSRSLLARTGFMWSLIDAWLIQLQTRVPHPFRVLCEKGGKPFRQDDRRHGGALSRQKIDMVLGIEARGFIFGPALAYRLNAGFVPVRKPRKLPAPVARVTYDLEYGSDTLEIHMDAIQPGQRVVLVDDLLATGGTMEATIKLVKELGGEIAGLAFAVELDFLKGRARFPEYDVFSLLHYDE